MAQGRTVSRTSGAQEAVIASTTRIRGKIAGDGDLAIDGEVEGEIAIRGNLSIGEAAVVNSDVQADSVSIAGTLEGSVSASGLVRVGAGAKVKGDLRGSGVSIEEGAQYAGNLDCEFELPAVLGGSSAKRR